jgi:uncharacterized protein (UPF0548 family)
MPTTEGVVVVAQENRFRVVTDAGQAVLFLFIVAFSRRMTRITASHGTVLSPGTLAKQTS